MLLSPSKASRNFLYPSKKSGNIEFERDESLYLACPGTRNRIIGIPGLENLTKEGEARCINDQTFILSNLKFNFSSVSCKNLPSHEAIRTKSPCYKNASKIIKIGFTLENEFITTHEVCRDDKTFSTYYTKFNLTHKINFFHSGYPRPRNWKSGNFYGKLKMDLIYRTSGQELTIAKQIGSVELAKKYIEPDESKYLAKGHMVAKADFVYGSAQTSTFWYLNAAPQWQTFNAGNWNSLEYDVRKLADKRSLDLVVYTGIHQQMTLNDINNNKVPIYMYINNTRKYEIPVPRFYWKIIYDTVSKNGTGFVGLNDPYADKITDDMFICDDISKRIKWLSWKANKISKGLSYACTVDDLRKAVPSIPKIHVIDVLI